jgi:hypothetical protein
VSLLLLHQGDSGGYYSAAPTYENLLRFSQQFDNALWTKTGATATADAAVAPDGTTTADKLVETAVTSDHRFRYVVTPPPGTYTYSVFVKAAERGWARVFCATGVPANSCFVNLATGALGATIVGTWVVEDAGNGWWRAWTTTGMPVAQALDVQAAQGNAISSYLGVVGQGIYVWGAQLVRGTVPGRYRPTS